MYGKKLTKEVWACLESPINIGCIEGKWLLKSAQFNVKESKD